MGMFTKRATTRADNRAAGFSSSGRKTPEAVCSCGRRATLFSSGCRDCGACPHQGHTTGCVNA